MKCDFSYKHYRKILQCALEADFVITNFRDLPKYPKARKIIILRHDIDALPKRHLELAKIEYSLGIKATYFVRVHGQYYHLAGKKILKILHQIKNMNHEMGLHSEARVLAPVFGMDARNLFSSEKNILEELLGVKILSASEHGDLGRSEDFWRNHLFMEIPKRSVGVKYYPQEYQKYHYLSDSLQKWQEGCLCQNITKYDKIQSLIHAEWWGAGAKAEMVKLNKTYAKI